MNTVREIKFPFLNLYYKDHDQVMIPMFKSQLFSLILQTEQFTEF